MAQKAKPKEEEQEARAPAWIVTYGDMMSLLLCFFIMLVAMSEIKDEKFQKLLESVKRAFGYDMGAEVAPGSRKNTTGIFEKLQMFSTPRGRKNVYGGAEVLNVRGKFFLCKTVREGRMITVGEETGFEKGSTEVLPEMRVSLDAIFEEVLKDYSNRLVIRGHTSARELPEGMTEWQLSFLRSKAVADYLERKGVNPRRLRLSACGGHDPIDTNLTPEGRVRNRRVEIVVSEELVKIRMPRGEANERGAGSGAGAGRPGRG